MWSVSWKLLKETRLQSLLSYDIRAYLFLCLHLFNISVRLFSILFFLCNAIFSFSFKHSELLLLLVLYAWCLPRISYVKKSRVYLKSPKYALISYDTKTKAEFPLIWLASPSRRSPDYWTHWFSLKAFRENVNVTSHYAEDTIVRW